MSLWRDICYDTVSVKLILINFKVHIFIWWLSRESLKLRLTWSLLLLVKYCCLKAVEPERRRGPFLCSLLCSISAGQPQQLLSSVDKMELIGQKEHSDCDGLATLAPHQGQQPNSIRNERILSALENLPLILSVSPNIFNFDSDKIVVSYCRVFYS